MEASRTFQRRMEQKATSSYKQVTNECHQEDSVVAMSETTSDTLCS
jgi:hypothetical protein